MTRWEPDAPGRLQQAALELFVEHGYDRTTVADIAAKAGLTERTFFRHYPDKREVLFDQSRALEHLLSESVAAAPASAGPMEAIGAALASTVPFFEARRGFARRRQAVIAANAELQERELIKLASLAGAIALALQQRGVKGPAARLAADAGIAAFRIAFERWATASRPPALTTAIRAALADLRAVTA